MYITNNDAMFDLWWKEILVKHQKISKNCGYHCLQNLFFFLLFVSLLTAPIVKNINILPGMMMIMNCFCGIIDRRKVVSLISRQDHCRRYSPMRISNTPRAGFELAQNLSSGFVEWSCAVVITTTTRHSIFLAKYPRPNSEVVQ